MSLRGSALYNSGFIGSVFTPNKFYSGTHCATEQNRGSEIQNNYDSVRSNKYRTPLNTLESEDLEVNGISKKTAFVNLNNELKYTYEIKKDYNPYLIPPDWNAAKRHGQARRVGIEKKPTRNNQESYDLCPCCDYQIQKYPINMFEDPIVLSFLGSGYPLFFNYMKFCQLILLLIILSSGAFNIVSNYYGDNCISAPSSEEGQEVPKPIEKPSASEENKCERDWISILSLANKMQSDTDTQDILNFGTIFVLMILLVFFRRGQKIIDIQCDINNVTPSDFTIMVTNLPHDVEEKEIKEFFEGFKPEDEPIEVTEISLVFNTQHLEELKEGIKKLIKQKKSALAKKTPETSAFLEEAAKWDALIESSEKELEKQMKEVQKDKDKFCGCAFVSFEKEDQKQAILESAQKSFWEEFYESIFSQSSDFKELPFKDTVLLISEAPEPLDIIWENLTTKDERKKWIRKVTFTLTCVLLCACTYIIYLLSKYSEDSQSDPSVPSASPSGNDPQEPDTDEPSNFEKFLTEQSQGLMITLAILFINSIIISYVFRYLNILESYNTITLYNINLAQKLSLALFINSALVTCFISIVYTKNVFGKGGLIYTIFYYFAVDSLTSFISQIFDYQYYLKKINQWWEERKGSRCLLTQEEANEICEMPDHEIEVNYAEIMNTMYITIFYSPAVPLGLFLSLLGLFLYYWAHKFALLNMKVVQKQISVKLSVEMTEYLEFIIIIYSISNALFKWQTTGSISRLQTIGALLGILYSFLPMQLFVEKAFSFYSQDESATYTTALPGFITTYSRTNPVTSIEFKESQRNYLIEKRNNLLVSNVSSVQRF